MVIGRTAAFISGLESNNGHCEGCGTLDWKDEGKDVS